MKATRAQQWFLLDEINLLPPQVLASLSPLRNGSAVKNGFAVPGQTGSDAVPVNGIHMCDHESGCRGRRQRQSVKLLQEPVHHCQAEIQENDALLQILHTLFKELVDAALLQPQDVAQYVTLLA